MDWYLNAASGVQDGLTAATGYHTFRAFWAAKAGVVGLSGDNVYFVGNIDDSTGANFTVNRALVLRSYDESSRSQWLLGKGVGGPGEFVLAGLGGTSLLHLDIKNPIANAQQIDMVATGVTPTGLPNILGCSFQNFIIRCENAIDLVIASNFFYDNSYIFVTIQSTTSRVIIVQNTFNGNTNVCIGIQNVGVSPNTAGFTIKNNAAYAPTTAFLYYDGDNLAGGTLYPDYNLIYNAGQKYLSVDMGTIVAGAHDSTKNPLFVNPAANDCSIGFDSPCFCGGETLIDDIDLPEVDINGVGLGVWYRTPLGCYNKARKDSSEVWNLYNTLIVFEVQYGHAISFLSTGGGFTGTRLAWINAFLNEFTAAFVTVQTSLTKQVVLINAIRSLFSLVPMAAVTIAGATHLAKSLSWANGTDTISTAMGEIYAVIGVVAAGRKTDYAIATCAEIRVLVFACETIAKKYRTNIEFIKTII